MQITEYETKPNEDMESILYGRLHHALMDYYTHQRLEKEIPEMWIFNDIYEMFKQAEEDWD